MDIRVLLCRYVLTLLSLILLFPWLAQADTQLDNKRTLKSASEYDYPPFAIVNSDGTAGGFSVDLLKSAAEATGFAVTFKVGPWHELKQDLAEGKIDVLPLVSYSEERKQVYDFTAPYIRMNGTVFIRQETTNIRSLFDLKDKEVLVMEGDTAHEYVTREKLSKKIFPVVSYEQAFKLLSAGKHDAVVVQQVVGLQTIKKLNITNVLPVEVHQVSSLKPAALKLEGFEQNFCFAVRAGNKQLLESLNEGLAVLYLNGTYQALYEKWFSPILPKPKIPTSEYIKLIVSIVVPLLLVGTLLGLWYLKRLVAQKTLYLEEEIKHGKFLEKEKEDANAKYIKAQQLGRVGNWEYNIDTQEFWGSSEAKRIYGFDEDSQSFTTEEVEGCIPERDRVHRALIDLIERNLPYNLEFDIITRDTGERRTISSLAELERDAAGKPVKVRGVIQDITERKKVEALLQESEQRHREYIQNSPIAVFVADEQGRYVQVNPAACRMTGYDESELLTMSIEDLLAEESRNAGLSHFQQLLLVGSSEGDLLYRTKNGATRWWTITAVRISDTRFLGFCNDITERKEFEEALKSSEEDLKESQKIAHIGSWRLDVATNKVVWSDELYRMCGFDPAYPPPPFTEHQKLFKSESWEQLSAALQNTVDTGTPYTLELETVQKNAEYGWMWVHGMAVIDQNGNTVGLRGVAQDITDRKRIEEEKNRLHAQLTQAQKMEAIGTLAGGIAHDFNNILGSIVGYSEMIREDMDPQSPSIHDINQVLKASYRAKDLVKQILAFSRQVENQKIPICPSVIIKEATTLLRSSLPATITIHQDIDPDSGMVFADPTQIHQIVMNLCTNAFHAMEVNGGSLTISLHKKLLSEKDLAREPDLQPGEFVELSIKDTGEGIPLEIRERIFDPFFTTKEVGKGTGLGLSMVYSIVKSSGGSITCDSRIGHGTEFRIILPVLTGHVFQDNVATELPPHGKEHILLVDDEEMLAELGQVMLQRLGYHVTTRRNSLDALTTFQNQPAAFDLIITDQTMPGMTGVDLARRILQIRPEMPIILCTGYSSLISEDKAKAAGIKGFAYKPLAKKDIGVLIRKILDKKNS